ncbi:MAG TPA: pyruvate carboxylase, partial [Acidimicrobiales bacterium]|nr:pyruvate carboxylase [Acidimicrobiales bacterium]
AEDPLHDFRPDTGVIVTYRAPGGTGIRLDEGITQGTEILPYFDSLLAKLTCRGRNFEEAVDRARRAIAEFRIRGVATNVSFLQAILEDEDFRAGRLTTGFIDARPTLLTSRRSADRATRLLEYLAEMTVNRPHGEAPAVGDPRVKLPPIDLSAPAPPGSRQLLDDVGPVEFGRQLRARETIAVTDTTFRDAHQSLLATRLRTYDIIGVARHVARMTPELLSLECWGGATYDVALRFLKEDPFYRLEEIRAAVPNICLQMLVRGRNTVGYSPYPDAVGRAFITQAAAAGIDIFRIFDALNDADQMRPAIDAVVQEGKIAEGTLCYTGDLADPTERLYTLDYYLDLAERLVEAGAHVLCIKDMAGLLRAPSARILVTALRARFDQPVHLHTHDTAGGQLATYLAAIESGVDAVDGAIGPLSGMTSQPNLAAIVAATDFTPQTSGLSLAALLDLEPYWEAVRLLYRPFESGLPAPTGRVYRHEIPGGQLSNLRQQAIAVGLGDRFEVVEDLYASVNAILGNIIKVTPTSKVVGDLALHLAAQNADPEEFASDPGRFDIPDSVVGFLSGELGTPAGGWPEPFRTAALAGRSYVPPSVELTDDQKERLSGEDVRAVLAELLFPGPAREFAEATSRYGQLADLPTRAFFYGLEMGEEIEVELAAGVILFLRIDAMTAPDARGYRNVYCQMNGRPRTVTVRDLAVESLKPSGEKALAGDPFQIGAPFTGVATMTVRVGDSIEAGQAVATIEAMKMEASVTSPVDGVVARVALPGTGRVESGDLLAVIAPSVTATDP